VGSEGKGAELGLVIHVRGRKGGTESGGAGGNLAVGGSG